MQEIALMAQAEREMREFLAAEKRQKEEEEQRLLEESKSTAASSDTKSSQLGAPAKKAPAPKLKTQNTIRSRGRANVSRLATIKPQAKPKKKPKQDAAAAQAVQGQDQGEKKGKAE